MWLDIYVESLLFEAENLWRIEKFKFNLKYTDGNANLEASQ